MATETPAQMAARFRKIAQDPKLPQAVKNTYLDKANEVEKAAAKPTMAKGGAVKAPAKKMMSGGAVAKELPKRGQRTATYMAKGGAVKKDFKTCEGCPSPAKCKAAGKCMAKEGKGVAIMIAVAKPAAKKGK